MRRVPTYYQDLIDIVKNNPGHVIGATACLGGYLPTQLLLERNKENQDYTNIYNWICLMQSIFNDDFYLEMQPSDNKDQIYVNNELLKLSNQFNIPYIQIAII